MAESGTGRLVVLMPIYEDWESASVLVGRVDAALRAAGLGADFLLVNDGSISKPPASIPIAADEPPRVEVLHLRRNLGHQRAIAIGLSHVQARQEATAAVVMDGDGEDTAEGVVILAKKFHELKGERTVFAARARRTEGFSFQLFYRIFKLVHWLLTGRTVRVGNFSVVPLAHLDRLVAVSEVWNHYAAAIFKARLPIDMVEVDRGHRIAGESRMSFVSLLAHGLSAISVFSDVVGLRLLVGSFILAGIALLGVLGVVAIRLTSELAIPGWATAATGVLVVILLQAFLMATVFVFIILQGRSGMAFLPVRDHVHFIDRVEELRVER